MFASCFYMFLMDVWAVEIHSSVEGISLHGKYDILVVRQSTPVNFSFYHAAL